MHNVIIYGPTAIGKTKASIEISKKLGGQIISADSAQIYKGLDIGTAKISTDEMSNIPHHMLNIINPFEEFSVADFLSKSNQIIQSLNRDNISTVTVGGSSLYIKRLVDGISTAPKSNPEIRKMLLSREKEDLYENLKKIDPKYASSLSPNNKLRVARALEIFLISGKNISSFNSNSPNSCNINFKKYALIMDREVLYQRINFRVDEMFENGLLIEAEKIFFEYGKLPPIIGYRELEPYFRGMCSIEEVQDQIKQNSRRYAKRQITWLNKMDSFKIINVTELDPIKYIIEDLKL